jgi:hypothetical protein
LLTNDSAFRRVTELRVLLVDDLAAGGADGERPPNPGETPLA